MVQGLIPIQTMGTISGSMITSEPVDHLILVRLFRFLSWIDQCDILVPGHSSDCKPDS